MTNDSEETSKGQGSKEIVTPALIRAARETYRGAIRKSLAEAGFDDLPRNGPFVLGAMVNFGIPSSEVVRDLRVTKQAASQLIDVLVLRGYLERVTDPDDRRKVNLKPTERGRAAALATQSAVRSVDRELARRHTAEEVETFRSCLMTLIGIGVLREGGADPHGKGWEPSPSKRTTRLLRFDPIFPVKDLKRTLEHYKSLGFSVKAYEDGADYGFAVRDGIWLHFVHSENHDPARNAGQAYLQVEDADDLYAEWTKPAVGGRTMPVVKTEYGLREGTHIDPDNNVIRFGSEADDKEEQ